MRIRAVGSRWERIPLRRPYTIAFRSIEAVEMALVELQADGGEVGLGAATPERLVTGESREACREALEPERLEWLVGEEVTDLPRLCHRLGAEMGATPAARAAVDMALHDLLGKLLGRPLADLLGRFHGTLPTSVTIGILGVEETLAEAREHLAAGFSVLKVKLGHSLEEDLERLAALRRELPGGVALRVDANQGYSPEELQRFFAATGGMELELVEQPLAAGDAGGMRALPVGQRRILAADESLLGERDALALATPEPACGIFNVKLMKCGGIQPARRIAAIAETAAVELMWGCMDESVVGIAAALHAALASPATRYLDLDGSFDLARDPAEGGFLLEEGWLSLTDRPGLGVRLVE